MKLHESARVLKAWDNPVFFAEDFLHVSLFPKQAEILKKFYSLKKKTHEPLYNELVLIAGMRSGKTFLGSVIATYELFKLLVMDSPQEYYNLASYSPLFIVNIATSEQQARDTVFAQIRPKIMNASFFMEFRPKIYTSSISFEDKNIKILALTSSQASAVGRTCKAVIFDELARFKETEKGVRLLYQSLTRATMNFGMQGKRVVITSPIYPNDFSMQLFHTAAKVDSMLAYRLPTWEINPFISFEDLASEREKDPASFWRDYGANPEAAAEKIYFREPERIKKVMILQNKLELLHQGILTDTMINRNFEYIIAIDPALKNDAFGISIGHLENSEVVIDGSFRFKPGHGFELSPLEVKTFLLKIISAFKPSVLLTDVWYFPETLEAVKDAGVSVVTHIVKKTDYDLLKERIYTNTIKLPRYNILYEELANLQVVNPKRVDHTHSGSKDVSDTVANIVQFLSQYRSINMPFFVETI